LSRFCKKKQKYVIFECLQGFAFNQSFAFNQTGVHGEKHKTPEEFHHKRLQKVVMLFSLIIARLSAVT